jgi:hypothetical protein
VAPPARAPLPGPAVEPLVTADEVAFGTERQPPWSDGGAARAVRVVAQSPQRQLDGNLRRQLERLLARPLPAPTLYIGSAVDRLLDRYRADALTRGREILIRQDKFRPQTPAGAGLLGHELTHSTQPEPATSGARVRQESEAMRNERRVLEHYSRRPGYDVEALQRHAEPSPAHGPLAAPQVEPAARHLAPAAADVPVGYQAARRDRDARGEAPPAAPQSPMLSTQQIQIIKDAVYRDLLDRIRSDFERGA